MLIVNSKRFIAFTEKVKEKTNVRNQIKLLNNNKTIVGTIKNKYYK